MPLNISVLNNNFQKNLKIFLFFLVEVKKFQCIIQLLPFRLLMASDKVEVKNSNIYRANALGIG